MHVSTSSLLVLASAFPRDWPLPSVSNEASYHRFAHAAAGDFARRGFAPVITDGHARSATCVVDSLHGQLLSSDWMAPASLAHRKDTK